MKTQASPSGPSSKASALMGAVKATFERQVGSSANPVALTIAYSTDQG